MIVAPERLDGVTRVLDEMHGYHSLEPCWYLPFLGVGPRHQGQGFSAKLMKCPPLNAMHRACRPVWNLRIQPTLRFMSVMVLS